MQLKIRDKIKLFLEIPPPSTATYRLTFGRGLHGLYNKQKIRVHHHSIYTITPLTLRSSVWVVFNNFLIIDATDRSKISSNHHRIFFDISLYHISCISSQYLYIFYYYTLYADGKRKLSYILKSLNIYLSIKTNQIMSQYCKYLS